MDNDDVTKIEGESVEEIVVETDDSSDIIVDGLPEDYSMNQKQVSSVEHQISAIGQMVRG